MKKLLLTLALALSTSALARAQTGGLERRVGDMFFGPVREARIETAVRGVLAQPRSETK